MNIKVEEHALSLYQRQELWHLLIESKGNITQVTEQLRKSQEFIEKEALDIFIECLLICNKHLGKKENEDIIRKISVENMLSIIQQASQNSYYASVKNLSVLMSMIQCALHSTDLERNLKECQQQIRFESMFFEVKSLLGNNAELPQSHCIIVQNDAVTSGTFKDIYVKLDLQTSDDIDAPKKALITDKQFLATLNKIMAERKIPYWEQVVVKSSLMQSIFGN